MDKKDSKNNIIIVFLSIIFVALLVTTSVVTWNFKNGEQNSVIVYFSYEKYTSPTMEYRLDKEKWAVKDLEPNTEKSGFTHKIVIPLGNSTKMIAKFKDKSNKDIMDDNSGRYYTFTKGTYLFRDGALVRLDEVGKFNIVEFKVSPNANSVSIGTTVNLKVSTNGGNKPITYKFIAKDSAGVETVIQDFSQSATVDWNPETAGNYMLTAISRDKDGAEATKNIEGFQVVSLTVKSITPSLASPQKVGSTIGLKMDIDNSAGLDLNCYYEINDGTQTTKLDATTIGAADWIPEKAGNYKITGYIESGDKKSSCSMDYVIEDNAEQSEVTIYYHSYDPCDIFFCQTNENNTSYDSLEMTGDVMVEDTSREGYEYKYTTSLSAGNVLVVSFMNKNTGATDNNNRQYYVLHSGVYGIQYNQVYSLENNNYNETEDDDEQDYDEQDNDEQDNEDNDDFQWQYGSTGNQINHTNNKVGGKVRVYYKDSDFKYIHYQIGDGAWTKEPGEKMRKNFFDSYKRTKEINLNNASFIRACFTDGNGNWDNNNGANYMLQAGTYFIEKGRIVEYKPN